MAIDISRLDDNAYKKRLSVASALLSKDNIVRAKGSDPKAADYYALFNLDPKVLIVNTIVDVQTAQAGKELNVGVLTRSDDDADQILNKDKLVSGQSIASTGVISTLDRAALTAGASSEARAAFTSTTKNSNKITIAAQLNDDWGVGVVRITIQYLEPETSTGEFMSYYNDPTIDNFGRTLV